MEKKYHPGHWIAPPRRENTLDAIEKYDFTGVVGLAPRFTWKELEPANGQYNFDRVQLYLDWCARRGLYLIIFVEDKTFTSENPLPDYLASYAVQNSSGGVTTARWNVDLLARFMEMVSNLLTLSKHLAFEGISIQESAPSLSAAAMKASGYDAVKYRSYYSAVAQLFTSSSARFFPNLNFFPSKQTYIRDVLLNLGGLGGIGGYTDTLPESVPLTGLSYPLYTGMSTLFAQISPDGYSERRSNGAIWTMAEIDDYAEGTLGAAYRWWTPYNGGVNKWADAVKVISGIS